MAKNNLIMKNFPLIFLTLLLSLGISAQSIDWQEVTQSYELPDGLKFFHGTKKGDATFAAWYFEVDMNNPDIGIRPYLGSSFKEVPLFCADAGAYAAINGGFFAGNSSVSSVVYPNEVVARNIGSLSRSEKTYPVIRSVFAINEDNSPAVEWVYHHSTFLNDLYVYDQPLPYRCDDPNPLAAPVKGDGRQYENISYGLGGGPVLISNGDINITYCEEIFWGSGVYLTDYRPRTAVGYTTDNKVIMFVTNHMKIEEMAEELLDLRCHGAMNLDGGGSTAMSVGGESIYNQNRAVPTILAIVHKDSMNLPQAPLYENFIDTGDEGVTSSGGWFATANEGYWKSRSMLHGLATDDSYYEFPLNLPAAGEYEIHGWWTSHPNRSSDTPYYITHADGVAKVSVNQSINGSTWNHVGTFKFKGTEEENVRITAAATTNQFVVADAIRVVSYDQEVLTGGISRPGIQADKIFNVFPNPGKGLFTLEGHEEPVSAKVFSIDGRKVLDVQFDGMLPYTLNLQHRAPGIYILSLTVTGIQEIHKIIIR